MVVPAASGSENPTYNSAASSSGTVGSFEAPLQTLMCNDREGDPWKVNITLMYTQDSSSPFPQSTAPSSDGKVGVTPKGGVNSREVVTRQKNEKSLRELLEEQDVGKLYTLLLLLLFFFLAWNVKFIFILIYTIVYGLNLY